MELKIEPIAAFSDNYLWLLSRNRHAAIVDPGDAAPVLRHLEANALTLDAILVTHWHPDHIGGIQDLRRQCPVPVYGPRAESARIPALTHLLDGGDSLRLDGLDLDFTVIAVPGHTLGHVAYHAANLLFCGDTLFSMGCGRLFEGTPAQMHDSLARLAALPDSTAVYCTHEYTLANLAFARTVEPGNAALLDEQERVRRLRALDRPSLPTSIGHEKRLNPFLRCSDAALVAAVAARTGRSPDGAAAVFAELRRWKDGFRV